VSEPIRVSPWVTHERLDDEVIAINLETGAYYALDGVAADCWVLSARGSEIDDLVVAITERYEVAEPQARSDVTGFLEELLRERLVVAGNDTEPLPASPLPPLPAKKAYVAPAVQKYDDLEDLLLLDPIHEVDEAGWPVARAD
jgi:Coenzyme PQQ synthesis protein D (PqqD)